MKPTQVKKSQQLIDRAESLAEKYSKRYPGFMRVLENSTLSRAISLQPHHYAQLGMSLDKVRNYIKLKEADGTATDLGTVPNIALDVVTYNFVSSATPIICNMQQLSDERGIVWYEQTKATTTRGNVTAGQILQNPLAAPQVYAEGYANAQLTVNLGTTVNSQLDYTYTAAFERVPVKPRSVRVVVNMPTGILLATDPNGDGNLFGNGLLGTVDYETGDVVLKFGDNPGANIPVVGTYATDIEASGNISTINVDLLSKEINATAYALQAQIGLFKQYAMSKRLGINASDRLAQKLSDEMANELTTQAIAMVEANAVGVTNWNKAMPAGVSWYLHKQGFKDALNEAEGVIFDNAGRGGITCIIASRKAATLFKSMPGFSKAALPVGAGATLYGTYEGVPIIRAPQLDDGPSSAYPNGFAIPLYRGDQPYDGAIVHGTYMPLVSIKDIPVSTNITMQRQGVATWSGFAIVAPNFITRLNIIDDSASNIVYTQQA